MLLGYRFPLLYSRGDACHELCALFLQVKYRMDGDVAKTICHVDEKAKDIEHAKKVSQQVSKVRSWCGWLGC